MIRGSQLIGRAVIDMEAAARLGKIKEIILQRDGEHVAGFVVAEGESILGSGGKRRIIPASALNAIGPDAITVKGTSLLEGAGDLDSLPRMSDVIGHKMVTRSGRLLGSIDDVLMDAADGSIIGYSIGEGIMGKLESAFGSEKKHLRGYVRADADLQVGNDLVVVPDDAAIEGDPTRSAPREGEARHAWGTGAATAGIRSLWSRKSGAGASGPSSRRATAAEPSRAPAANRPPVERGGRAETNLGSSENERAAWPPPRPATEDHSPDSGRTGDRPL